jgi:hypothetical protein
MYLTGNEPMIPKSGDADFDFALAHALAKMSDVLEVHPGFAFYSDVDGKNAYATSRRRLANADGTVLFGQGLLAELRGSPDHPEIAVTAVCAHEFGHILQYKRGLIQQINANQTTVKRSELQADFFAGFFAGLRKLERPNYAAAVVASTQSNYGDYNVNSEGHHGTPQERGAAVVAGFKAAFNDRKNLAEAISISINYVMAL